jgi:molybdopterin converting factor small subunit
MSVHVKLSATLRDHVPGYVPAEGLRVDVRPGETVAGLARGLGLPADQLKIIMVNGMHANLDAPVADGDRVAYFPPVGGG